MSVTALVMVCTILLVIVLAGVGCAVAVLVLRQRRKTGCVLIVRISGIPAWCRKISCLVF